MMDSQTVFLSSVSIHDPFWDPIRETVRKEGIPYQWKALNDLLPPDAEPSHCMHNFRVAAGREQGSFGGYVFQDSDAAKWLESVAWTLTWHPDPELEAMADKVIEEIVAAQQPDGYLDTYYIINGLEQRWTNLTDNHELYVAGHMIEAAVAYFQATGKRSLLDAVIRLADHIDSRFGPEPEKLKGYPGHPVIEMALIRLYQAIGNEKYKKLAKYFIDQRGQKPLYFREERENSPTGFRWKDSPYGYQYYQAGLPVRSQTTADGHSVRALYLYSGMADVARLTGDSELMDACRRLWTNAVTRRMYITGAVGSSEYGEAFTFDYDLPNDTVYGETCASIALIFLAQRLLLSEPRAEYADVMERALYNTVLSGMQLNGKKYFYVNPLEVLPEACEKDYNKRHVKPERQKWFGCACCPPNLNRLIASLQTYIWSLSPENAGSPDTLRCHLYISSSTEVFMGGVKTRISMDTAYPWEETVHWTVAPEVPVRFALALRIPGWCTSWLLQINGEEIHPDIQNGYAVCDRIWQPCDRVDLQLNMPVQINRANPRVYKDAGLVAVSRGPVVYCLEEADNGPGLHRLLLAGTGDSFSVETAEIAGRTVQVLHSAGYQETDDGWGDTLYSSTLAVSRQEKLLTWIPYFAWANRGLGEMRVWVRRA